MADDSDAEKSLAPSAKRLADARNEGQLPRSRELATFGMVGGSILFLLTAGGSLMQGAQGVFRAGMTFDRAAAFAPNDMATRLGTMTLAAFQVFFPLMVLAAVGAVCGILAIGGWNFTTRAFELKPERMDPIAGIKRMFSLNTVGEIGKATLAMLLVGSVAFWFIRGHIEDWAGMADYEVHAGIGVAMHDMGLLLAWLIGPMIVIAGTDGVFSFYKHRKALRMTHEEQRLEAKDAEGNPEIKRRVRQQQREMSRKRMMAAVPKADVVITNPTHYSVALRYQEGSMRAPIVVAKGVDLTAARIREIAAEHQVMLVESPPLARALYRNTEVDQEIPGPLFTAVAQVLAYVFQVRAGMRHAELGQIEVDPALDIPAAARAGSALH